MKKILLLGGSAQQVIAIETAKKLGYYTVLCDFLQDNPGQYYADKFYLESTTDKEKILEIAINENIDGIIAYASDPAAPTAAYVAEKLDLPGNPYESVETLCNKDRFRTFLQKNGFNAPESRGYMNKEDALNDTERFELPVIVKPVDSSGSKGATVIREWCDLPKAVDFAFSFSRGKRIIIEEFIEKKHEYLIGGDVFVIDGKVVLWGLLNCHRDAKANPLVPVGKSYPVKMEEKNLEDVKQTLQDMITKLHFVNGAMNVELVVDKNNKVWPIDVGPRCGGNMIPDLLGYIFGVDVVEISVLLAMGEKTFLQVNTDEKCYATHNLHAIENGIYKDIVFDEEIEKYIIQKCLYKKNGDEVFFFDNAAKALGIVFMRFDTQVEMDYILNNISNHIKVVVE